MWDDKREVGILNDFDLAKLSNRPGASGQDNTGTLPFMALELLSEQGLHGDIPRRYRHEAESFTWTLVCLYCATVKDENGKNGTGNPHPLGEWFYDYENSRRCKLTIEWERHKGAGLAYPKAKPLVMVLYDYWVVLYNSMKKVKPDGRAEDGEIAKVINNRLASFIGKIRPSTVAPTTIPTYVEHEDEEHFKALLTIYTKDAYVLSLDSAMDAILKNEEFLFA